MGNEAILSILDNAFVICLVLAIAFLILSAVLFFALHIHDTIYELSGRARRDATKKMEENYSLTGSLRKSEAPGGTSGETKTQQTKKKHDSGGLLLTDKLPKGKKSAPQPGDAVPPNQADTAVLNTQQGKQPGTVVLKNRPAPPPAAGTVNRTAGTAGAGSGGLKLSKNIMLIHTNEIIQ